MAISELYSGTAVTIGTTELSLVSGTTTLQTITTAHCVQVILDGVANMAKADEFLIQIYEKVEATGGTKHVVLSSTISDTQAEPWVSPVIMLCNGWDITVDRQAGADRAFDWSIRSLGACTEIYELDGVTVGTTELSIVSGTTTLQTVTTDAAIQVWVDPVGAGMAKGDEFVVRVYETARASGTKRVIWSATLSDAVDKPVVLPTLCVMHGWDATLQKVAGTDRAWDASIRRAGA